MPQFLRPNQDITTGSWTRVPSSTNPFYTYLDEVTPDNTDYVTIAGINFPFEVKLSSATDPQVGTGHIIRVRDWVVFASGAAERRTILLLQGSTTISTLVSAGTISRTVGNQTAFTLTEAEANAITNYSDLRLRFTVTTIGSGENYRLGWAEMEVPDPPPPVTTRYVLVT